MSFFSKLFGKESQQEADSSKIGLKLQDIPLNRLGMNGEEALLKLAEEKDYEGMKFKSLELYNQAYDEYLEMRSDDSLNLMYATMKNFEACELMWFYHDQILGLYCGDEPDLFVVCIYPTLPFEFPESRIYHEKAIPSQGLCIPLVSFYQELASSMQPVEKRFVYDIIVRHKD